MSAEGEGFLSRWSRRKREAAAMPEPPPAEPADPAGTEAEAPPPAQAAASPACPIPNLPEIDLASLPRIEDLTAESDFSLFLRPGVPPLLRHAALRRMWSLDPTIRDYIGPVEYQWDFNAPGGLPTGFANELGGEVRKLLAQAIGQRDEEAEAAAPPPDAPADAECSGASDGESGADVPPPEQLAAAEPVPDEEVTAPDADPPAVAARPRRHGRALPV